jgi:glycosyltransferase 2 family protein
LLKAAAISILFFLIWALSVWCLALSAGLRMLDFPTALLILAAVNVAQLIPLSVNGWGVREGALIVLLSAYAVPPEQALLVSLLVAAAGLLTAVIGGIIVLADYRYIRETQSTAAQSGSPL